jgi:chromosomal replication initiator protein
MIDKIEDIICKELGMNPIAIHVKDRTKEIKETRQIIMFFARKMTKQSFGQIAGYFNLDHTSAIHARKTIQNYIDTDISFSKQISFYESKLKILTINKTLNYTNILH